MGYEAEDQLPEGDYNCEKCRPDQHHDLLKCVSGHFALYLLSLMAIVTTGGCQKEVVTRLLTLRQLRHAYHAPIRHHIF
jgi:hypothetical protein